MKKEKRSNVQKYSGICDIALTSLAPWHGYEVQKRRLVLGFSQLIICIFFFIRRSENVVKEYFGSISQFSAFT